MMCSHQIYVSDSNQTLDVCDLVYLFRKATVFTLWQVMLVPILVLIAITIYRRDKDDTKWFVFHIAVLNLFVITLWELTYIFPDINKSPIMWFLLSFSTDLATNSIFPLAFTRFLVLYFHQFYTKFFTRKTIFFFLLGYDLIILSLFTYYYFANGQSMFMLIVYKIILLGTFMCASLVFSKIHTMKKLVKHNSEVSHLNNLNRAAFLCIFQASINLILLMSIFFTRIYQINFMPQGGVDAFENNFFYALYLTLYILNLTMYQFSVILDTVTTLLILKSYRHTVRRALGYIFKIQSWRQFSKKKVSRITQVQSIEPNIQMNIIRPSV